jgi:hypothetical protein
VVNDRSRSLPGELRSWFEKEPVVGGHLGDAAKVIVSCRESKGGAKARLIQRASQCYLLPSRFHLTTQEGETNMAKRSAGFNLSETIREFQKSHRRVPATAALEAVKKAHASQKINESTFRATFYKLVGGKKKSVRRRKPGRLVPGHGGADHIMKAGLNFILAAGGVEEARERLVGLAELIETAKEVD